MRAPTVGPRVAMVVEPAVSAFEFSTVWEIFGSDPRVGRPWYRLAVYSASPPPVRTCWPGLALTDVRPLATLRRADLVIVPPPSTASEATLDAIRRLHAGGARVASLCTGAFVLAAAGLLDGRPATTHWGSAAALAAQYPEVDVDPRVLYIDDGDVLTSAGSAACIDLCLHIVRGDYGAEVANTVARELVMPPHRSGGQAQFVTAPVQGVEGGDLFSATLEWATANLDEPLTVEMLAERSAMSPRTFARRFQQTAGTTPLQWVLRQRVTLAQRLLERTDLAIDLVAARCGLGTPTNLRGHFQRLVGTTPTDYRRTFRNQAS